MSPVWVLSKAFCSAWKSGTPRAPLTTISPSSQPDFSGSREMALARCGSLCVQSWPLRVKSCTDLPSTRASSR